MNSVRVIADSQKDAMEKFMLQISISSTIIFIINWGLVSLIHKITPLLWWSGIIWLALIWCLYVCVLWEGDYLHQAHVFHLIVSAAFLGEGLICWDAAFRLLLRTVDLYVWLGAILFLTVATAGVVVRTLNVYSRLQVHQALNIASGRFRDDTNEWDLTAPMYLDTFEKTKAYKHFWQKMMLLAPIFWGLATIVWRQRETLLMSGMLSGILGLVMILGGVGLHLGVTFYLLRLKRQKKLPVYLLSD